MSVDLPSPVSDQHGVQRDQHGEGQAQQPGATAVTSLDVEALLAAALAPSRSRRWPLYLGAFVAGIAVTAAMSALLGGGSDDATEVAADLSTVAVERRDLQTSLEWSGTSSAGETVIIASSASGTVTAAAPIGTVLGNGTVLARLDGDPVIVLEGATPVWRDLSVGITAGPDVAQLETYLVAGGFASGTAMVLDQTFDEATAVAVRAWQSASGQAVTGSVAADDIIFVPAGGVLTEAPAVGEVTREGAPLATVDVPGTPTVTLAVPVADVERFSVGDDVVVALADGAEAVGTVSAVAGVATVPASSAPGAGAEATVEVTVALAAGGLVIEGPATVRLPDQQAEGVLAVPTRSLVALAEGGQAVEIVGEDGVGRLVAVETGVFDDGWVEVSGDGLAAGVDVLVPA